MAAPDFHAGGGGTGVHLDGAGYYVELDLLSWARREYGIAFATFVEGNYEPVDFVMPVPRYSTSPPLCGQIEDSNDKFSPSRTRNHRAPSNSITAGAGKQQAERGGFSAAPCSAGGITRGDDKTHT